jgi:ABC-type transport system substrate-binding protein
MIFFVFTGLMATLLLSRLQDTRSRTILILIDRPPNTLYPGQNPDVTARRILPLLEELRYSLAKDSTPEDFTLIPPDPSSPDLRFKVVREDLTRGVMLQSGRADVLFDTLSLSKSSYFERKYGSLQKSPGFHLSYLGFNLRHPVLSRIEVRRALSKALPVQSWIRNKYFGFVDPIPGSPREYDPEAAARELDQAGFPRSGENPRFSLRYLTTPVREGAELALLVRESLRSLGIHIEIIPLEPSLFFSKLNRSDFELFGSRIPRSNGGEPVSEFFTTGGRRNYFSFSDPRIDHKLHANPDAGFDDLLPEIREKLPILPLFTWSHGLALSKRVRFSSDHPVMPDDSFRFLSLLRLN